MTPTRKYQLTNIIVKKVTCIGFAFAFFKDTLPVFFIYFTPVKQDMNLVKMIFESIRAYKSFVKPRITGCRP
jgi:hypothetical protein